LPRTIDGDVNGWRLASLKNLVAKRRLFLLLHLRLTVPNVTRY
jgi:hypothetical protein